MPSLNIASPDVLPEEDEQRQQRDGVDDLGGHRDEQQQPEEPPHPLAGVPGHRDAGEGAERPSR